MTDLAEFHDELVAPGSTAHNNLPDRFFDRFMFNAHPTDRTSPSIVLGCGLYPTRNVIDGFAVVVTGAEQRNLRWSTELNATDWRGGGPFRFETLEPNRVWRVVLSDNPSGLAFDLTWRARTPAWIGDVEVHNSDDATPTRFEHLVQSGYHHGSLTVDGVSTAVDGWYGQRDRSRGVRTMSGGQGLHLWFQAQFADRSVGFLLVEDRHGGRILLEGAVMHAGASGQGDGDLDGGLDPVVDVRHDLRFDDGLDLRSGTVEVATAAGRTYVIDCDASAGGGFLAGGGYGGQHGRPRGRDHLEHDTYPLDGAVSPRTLDTALTDRLTGFTWDGTAGTGIFEFAHSRSRSYVYLPTHRRRAR
ncbi:hypothetical protein Ga0074812_1588 [Parafrankia irregularis]|uniref:Uncharacterized protein n=1 Tax=Parafrankia irregularis TaxID=795642 RepID=A0A0S4R0T2_9ACTN|nr:MULTISPECIES: hypothetical protein [Parafrankia]MBE3200291.1 hypothetical protein [Parafrankia sp. CH37]CUU61145.1 hypothetical protein Ga0074812_1588 [Parafrankia irregularis]